MKFLESFSDINKIIRHYKKPKYSKSDSSSEIVGWVSVFGQHQRFKLLTKYVKNRDKILDYGCGLGELYNFFIINKYNEIDYTGVDINQNFIKKCKETWYIESLENPNINFYTISKNEDIKEKFDWVIASGVFTVYTSNNQFYDTIDYLYNISNIGISFNLFEYSYDYPLEKNNDSNDVPIRGYDINKLYKYFLRKYSNSEIEEPILFNDNEYTFYIKK